MDWAEFAIKLFTSEAFISLAVMILIYVYCRIRAHFEWKAETWEGLIASAFLAAEKAGLATGNQKVDFALLEFTRKFSAVNSAPPTASDLRAAALAFAKLAYDLKFAKGS